MTVTKAQAIRARLATLGLPQHALAAALGVSQATLSLWLNGYREPPPEFEAEASEALDLLERAEKAAAAARARVLNGRRVRRVGEAPGLAARLGRRTEDGSIALRCSASITFAGGRQQFLPVE
ncbi:MAG: helix-turn-helix transcriptional regulator, partial [Acidobacteria bacterium]|nr:helix-turn-helix transcriptional regulator [Acidobacteriota bacterium]